MSKSESEIEQLTIDNLFNRQLKKVAYPYGEQSWWPIDRESILFSFPKIPGGFICLFCLFFFALTGKQKLTFPAFIVRMIVPIEVININYINYGFGN